MTKFKKVLLASTAAVMTVAIAIGGTMAYLTSEDSDVNVMTLGNVKIAQHEFERATDENGAYKTIDVDGVKSYELKEFTQAKPLYPFVGAVDQGYDAIPVRLAQLGHNSRGGMDVFPAKNVQDKFVVVENTGKSDAYVRTIVAFEAGSVVEEDWYKIVSYSSHFTWKETQDWFVTEINGNNYYLVEFVYNGYEDIQHPNGVLTPGDYTYNSLAQVYMFDTATNEDVEALDGNKNGAFDILVLSQAVQTKGFDNAKTALDAAFGGFDATNVKGWFGETTTPAVVNDADGLVEALANDEDVILADDVKISPANMSNAYGKTGINVKNGQTIDGAGNTLDIKGAGGTWDSGINTTGGLIKDITVTGSFRGIFINHNSTHSERVILKNVVIKGTTYTISCDQGTNQGLTATNSTFNGWTSYAKTLGDAEFIDCSFGAGNGYSFCRPYAPTSFVGCDFEAGYQMDPVAAVTFENCTIGGVALTASNLSTLVTSNIKNATVK